MLTPRSSSVVPFTDIDKKYGFPEGLLDSIWAQESARGTHPKMVSSAGARGHFQFMPGTRPEIINEIGLDPWSNDPRVCAECAAYYLSKQLKRFDGDFEKALAAYNAGGGRVNSAIRNHGDGWLDSLRPETQNYVPKILGRIGMADRVDFTNRYNRGQVTDQNELNTERERRHRIMREELHMSDDRIAQMKDDELFGTSFLGMIMAFVKTLFEGVVQALAPSQQTPPPATPPRQLTEKKPDLVLS